MARLINLIRRRIIGSFIVLLIVIAGAFLMLEAAPGDAVDAYIGVLGADSELAQTLRQQWGLDGSVLNRFGIYLSHLAQGDLGWSVSQSRPVATVVVERLPTTFLLMGGAVSFSFLIGSLLGIVAGSRPGSWRDRLLSSGSLALYAVPGFWLGLVLIILFSIKLRWLPSSGIETVASNNSGLARASDIARHLVMPVVSLGLIYLALYLRVMRASMAEIWDMDFIRALRARGLSRQRIIWRHVVRNALLPLITMLGLQAATMLGGSVVIESVFAIPGLGRLAETAVSARDIPLLLGIILICALLVIISNLLVDVISIVLDPRIETDEGRLR